MNQGLNITKCRPGKGQTTEQLACYGQRLQVCNLKYKLAVNTVVCLSGCQSARNLAKKSQLSSAPRKKKKKKSKPCQDTAKEPQGICGLFGMPYLINVKRLAWVCRCVDQNLELSESMLYHKRKKKKKHARAPSVYQLAGCSFSPQNQQYFFFFFFTP